MSGPQELRVVVTPCAELLPSESERRVAHHGGHQHQQHLYNVVEPVTVTSRHIKPWYVTTSVLLTHPVLGAPFSLIKRFKPGLFHDNCKIKGFFMLK